MEYGLLSETNSDKDMPMMSAISCSLSMEGLPFKAVLNAPCEIPLPPRWLVSCAVWPFIIRMASDSCRRL